MERREGDCSRGAQQSNEGTTVTVRTLKGKEEAQDEGTTVTVRTLKRKEEAQDEGTTVTARTL
jgi:hypothetical protein